MKRKMISWLALLIVTPTLPSSCMQESLLQENDHYKTPAGYKVYTINRQQIKNDFFLFHKVAGIQNLMQNENGKAGKNSKSTQDSLLEGAEIETGKALVVENNGKKTYTFSVKRNYPSSRIENLVLKKNPDSSFSGKLVRYDLTLKERELFSAWHSIDLKNKVKIYNIENLNLSSSAKISSISFGCFTVFYEDGICTGGGNHVYGDTSCEYIGTSQQAQEPRVLSIQEISGCGNGGGNAGSTGNGTDPNPSGNGSDGGLTIIFDDINLSYYNSDNMTDPDYIFWSQVNQFIQGQPQMVKNFNNEYHFVYYYIHTYFKNNGGLTPANKAFVSQRLLALSTWYYDLTKASYLNTNERLSLAIWSEKYLLEHPDISWEQFYNQFISDPCEKTKPFITTANAILHNPTVQQNMDAILKGKVSAPNEWAVAIGQKPDGTYEVTSAVEQNATNGSIPSSQLASLYIADGHSHAGNSGNPSGGDLYYLIKGLKTNYPDVKYRYVYGNDGFGNPEVYAFIVNDKNLAFNFLTQFPESENYDPQTHAIKETSELGEEFYKATKHFSEGRSENSASGENYDSRAIGMAYILDKYNAGISISKVDASGNLKKINVTVEQIVVPYSGGATKEGVKVSKCP